MSSTDSSLMPQFANIVFLSPFVSVHQSYSALCFYFSWQAATPVSVSFILALQDVEIKLRMFNCVLSSISSGYLVSTFYCAGSSSGPPRPFELPYEFEFPGSLTHLSFAEPYDGAVEVGGAADLDGQVADALPESERVLRRID